MALNLFDDDLSSLGETIGGCQGDAALLENLFARFNIGAFKADNEGHLDIHVFGGGNDAAFISTTQRLA